MTRLLNNVIAVSAVIVLSGCAGAAFNRVSMTTNRNITVGQELIDLQMAHEKGIISDTEYAQAKQDVLNLTSTFGELRDD